MSDQEKSHIQSTSVSMGASAPKPINSFKKQTSRWNILICSDLGYISKQPEPIRAASLNDFIDSKNIIIRGNVKSTLENRDIFIEYPIKSLKDFSTNIIKKQLPQTADLKFLCNTLRDLLDGSMTKDKAIQILIAQNITSNAYEDAMALISQKDKPAQPPQHTTQPTQNSEKEGVLDSIFSAIDMAPTDEKKEKISNPALDNLVSAITSSDNIKLPKEQLISLIKKCERQIEEQTMEIINLDFFSELKSSWLCTRHAAKIIGRNSDINLFIYSTPMDQIEDSFQNSLAVLANQNASPDFVLFDYPLTLSTSHMNLLSNIGQTADKMKTQILAHCSQNEPLVNDVQNTDTLNPIFKEERFIPLNRLRKTNQARCIVLTITPFAFENREENPTIAGGSWFILFNLAKKLYNNNSPFNGFVTLAETDIAVEFPLRFSKGLTIDHSYEASKAGFTLLSREVSSPSGINLTTMIDPEIASELYTYFEYNLLVNRVLKVAGQIITNPEVNQDTNILAIKMKKVLTEQLAGYRLLHSENDVQVILSENRELSISIDSQKQIRDYALKLEFSFGI